MTVPCRFGYVICIYGYTVIQEHVYILNIVFGQLPQCRDVFLARNLPVIIRVQLGEDFLYEKQFILINNQYKVHKVSTIDRKRILIDKGFL